MCLDVHVSRAGSPGKCAAEDFPGAPRDLQRERRQLLVPRNRFVRDQVRIGLGTVIGRDIHGDHTGRAVLLHRVIEQIRGRCAAEDNLAAYVPIGIIFRPVTLADIDHLGALVHRKRMLHKHDRMLVQVVGDDGLAPCIGDSKRSGHRFPCEAGVQLRRIDTDRENGIGLPRGIESCRREPVNDVLHATIKPAVASDAPEPAEKSNRLVRGISIELALDSPDIGIYKIQFGFFG